MQWSPAGNHLWFPRDVVSTWLYVVDQREGGVLLWVIPCRFLSCAEQRILHRRTWVIGKWWATTLCLGRVPGRDVIVASVVVIVEVAQGRKQRKSSRLEVERKTWGKVVQLGKFDDREMLAAPS